MSRGIEKGKQKKNNICASSQPNQTKPIPVFGLMGKNRIEYIEFDANGIFIETRD